MEQTLRLDIDLIPSRRWMRDWVDKCLIICRRRKLAVEVDIDPPIRATSAVRLQWLLNDDPYRTLRNMARIRSGCKHWNRLFAEYPYPKWVTIYRRSSHGR